MKYPVFALALSMSLTAFMTGCHDKDDDNVIPPTPVSHIYEGMNYLDLDVNGHDVAGKRAVVYPGENGGPATLRFDSQVNLAEVSTDLKDIPVFAGPGVLPGSPVLSISVPLTWDDDEYKFSYSGKTDYVTYTVEGEFDGTKMDVDFENVRLKNQTFAGTAWKPMPYDGNNPLTDRQPFHIVWELDGNVQLPGIETVVPELETSVQDLLRMLVNVPFISVYNNTAKMSLTQVIANGFRAMGMGEDGNLNITYLQSANGAATFANVPYGSFQYVPLTKSAIRLTANPTDLLSLVLLNNTNRDPNIPDNPFGKASRADGMLYQLLQKLLEGTMPVVAEGMPLACVRQDNDMALYAGSTIMLPMIKSYILPILQNPAMRGIVLDFVTQHVQSEEQILAIMAVYDMLPVIMEHTTKVELGLNFVKA